MNLNIIVRGYLYKKNWTPLSTAKQKYPNYTQDFRELIENYKELFDNLSQKYKVTITFTSYDNCPEFIKEVIFNNSWNLHLISEENSTQFSSCCSYLKTVDDNVNLIIRSDLVIKKKLIDLLSNFDYQKCTNMIVLSKEPNRKLNDIFLITPPGAKLKIIKKLKNASHGHKLSGMIVSCFVTKRWCVTEENEYYQIYRGESSRSVIETDIQHEHGPLEPKVLSEQQIGTPHSLVTQIPEVTEVSEVNEVPLTDLNDVQHPMRVSVESLESSFPKFEEATNN